MWERCADILSAGKDACATPHVTEGLRLQGKLYLVENVDAEVCTECGERYFHATMLDEIDQVNETAVLSEQALAVDWNRPKEDEAWAHWAFSKKLSAQKQSPPLVGGWSSKKNVHATMPHKGAGLRLALSAYAANPLTKSFCF